MMTFKERDHWMRRLIADPELTAAAKTVGCRMALYLRIETGQLDPKIECLVIATSLSHNTVIAAIKALEHRGWLQVQRNGRYQQHQYCLLVPGAKSAPLGAKSAPDTPSKFAPVSGAKSAPGSGAKSAPKSLSEERKEERVNECATINVAQDSESNCAVKKESAVMYEWDMGAEDGSVFFRRSEIEDMKPDYPAIKDLRAQLRQAIRWAIAEEIEPPRRKAAILNYLRSYNDKKERADEFQAARLKFAAERAAKAENRQANGGARRFHQVIP